VKALQIASFGKPSEVVELAELPDPSPAAGELLVALEAAPINPSDLLLVRGTYGIRPALPARLGNEGVGRVVEVGAGVDPARVGERVLLLPGGPVQNTWAERAVVAERDAVTVDGSADPLQLAMIGVNPMTARLVLSDYAELKADAWVVQNSANSAVGRYLVDLARLAGLRTINIVRREEAAEQLRADGVPNVLVSGDDLVDQVGALLGGEQLGLVVDALGGSQAGELSALLRAGGKVVAYSALTGQPPTLPVSALIFRDISLHGFWLHTWLTSAPRTVIESGYWELAGLVADGTLSAPAEASYPIDQYREAISRSDRFRRAGKILFAF
jgi:NADPH:quinone reductase-like Zn-dependent oxidoreductase